MTKSGSTIDQVKDGVGAVVDKTREVLNDGLDSVEGTFNDGADNLDRFYRSTVEQLDDVRDSARAGYRHGRKTLSRLYSEACNSVSDNPNQSLLIAAGIGFLAGLVVRRRDPATGSVVTTWLPRARVRRKHASRPGE